MPVIFGSKHMLRPYSDTIQVLAGGSWREFPVRWPVAEYVFQIPWLNGLHPKPIVALIHLASRFKSQLRVYCDDIGAYADIINPQISRKVSGPICRIDGEILDLMGLGVHFGGYVRIQAKGPDACRTMHAIQKFIHEYNDRKAYRGNSPV